MKTLTRCRWVNDDPVYIDYHDQEWGVPIYDNQKLFEFLILEGCQAGLSWITILKRRENYRQAFDKFNPEKIAKYSDKKIASLLQNEGIIRNRLKIMAAVTNAQAYLELSKRQSFSDFLWEFANFKPLQPNRKRTVPPKTELSDQLSKALKKHGFKFVGSTICYAFMQAVGMINDHTCDCFRHKQLKK